MIQAIENLIVSVLRNADNGNLYNISALADNLDNAFSLDNLPAIYVTFDSESDESLSIDPECYLFNYNFEVLMLTKYRRSRIENKDVMYDMITIVKNTLIGNNLGNYSIAPLIPVGATKIQLNEKTGLWTCVYTFRTNVDSGTVL